LTSEKTISLGIYPEVTLAQTRGKRDDARALVAGNADPSHHRKDAKAKARLEALNTFEAVASEWHALHTKSKSERNPVLITNNKGRLSRPLFYQA